MIAKLHIQIKLRANFTVLKEAYCTPPFKLANISEDKKDKTLHLMLMSSSPGILDGDEYQIKVDLDESCHLNLQTQSYQRIFTMLKTASQHMQVWMKSNSYFCYLPHPTVPHENSNFSSKSKIFLSENCSLIWGEVLTCGRKLNGEVFKFTKYQNLTEIFLHGKLIIKENLLICPASINIKSIGQLEGYTHQASLIYLDENAIIKTLKEEISTFLLAQNSITFGITETPKNGLLVRILGQKAEQLHHCLKEIAKITAASTPKLAVCKAN